MGMGGMVGMGVTLFPPGAVLRVILRADPLHMVVMAFLGQAVMGLEADDLFAVFAKLAVHVVLAAQDAAHPFLEGIDDADLIAQILGLDKFDFRGSPGNFVNNRIDALDQDAGEQEIRKDDDPPVAACSSPGATSG